ncbi:unnamed protein product [Trifolium pratense]|uniref:Uncharacterized protein n=1 Tax=Trifolium pratense TaxID=57577 RepID=A0ACB0M8I4_TRIPR|nr:unnamed protein product [Trifolium pratense]
MLKDGEEWIQGVTGIKKEVKEHFSKHFSEEWNNRPFLQGIDFSSLSAEDNALLLAPFEEEEVKDTIWDCDGNKSPGPDGFNLNFFKACWTIVKNDVMAFLREFHNNAILPKAVTASFLTLIPKKDHPQILFDYRPICLIGSLYKILSRILANRLKRVLGKVISNCQSAFLPQRQILDGVLILNEILDLAKRRKDECLLFKVDFERAYDTVNWGFLERMMVKMGFSDGWLKWMRACIFESSMSILVNGSPTEDFKVGRGLRQGDPLSPFLFLIVAEGLTGMMRRAVEIGRFKGFQVNDSIQFQILQFADDTILMGTGIWDNLWSIKVLLRSFELVSGLRINFVKSKLYGINIDVNFLEAGSSFLSCSSDSIPFKFLGIPVGANPRRRETWKSVVDVISNKLSSWSSRQLSIGGRITLINSVLASMPLYFFSFFKAPSCILKQLVRIQRNFLWGGGLEEKKLCWIKWDHICLPKNQGGLGVKNLELFNTALLSKWKWRLIDERQGVWADLLRYRYGHLPTKILTGTTPQVGAKDSIWWRDILSIGRTADEDCFKSNVGCCVGDGNDIGFWKFKWFGNNSFGELYPNLYAKEAFKDVLISDRLSRNGTDTEWHWQWCEELSDNDAHHLRALKQLLLDCPFDQARSDRWRWVPDSVGLFTVKSCYSLLLQYSNTVVLESNVLGAIQKLWKNDVPSKVNIFGWRLLLEKLPTRAALHHRGILNNPHDNSCIFCYMQMEDCSHLFFNCSFVKGVWETIYRWLGQSLPTGLEGWNHFLSFGSLVKSRKGNRIRHLIWLATTWCLWKLRNNVVFNGDLPDASKLVDDIKTFSWFWFKGRFGRKSSFSFSEWCLDPIVCLQSIL